MDVHRAEKANPYTLPSKRGESLGIVRTVTVQKSAPERDAWYLEYVQVHDESEGRVYVCPVNRWFGQTDSIQHRFTCS
ncbi:PLAT/LH2 domain-containing protein [Actinoplanes sp. NEAU-A12]|uniref:PLAT/LH2 domain-containing protein n=1 Tax=Actinoplanes sandaracinus TaxID=3045177 RepID=A0ABT6WBC6_9ACTN|nr:PLAT/LH2 domain-containing protein [Actinoplanes sandaracinus]MDI6097025.1 PLAT/LH2 domain-containing protein [Actinoplanes sandaracinus]